MRDRELECSSGVELGLLQDEDRKEAAFRAADTQSKFLTQQGQDGKVSYS